MFKQFDFREMIKGHRVAFLVGAILALAIGVLCVITPFVSGAALVWIIIGLAGIAGLASIIKFIVPGKGNKRDVGSLLLGVLLVLCVTAIILAGALGKNVIFEGQTYTSMEVVTINLLGFGSIFFGVLSVINNIVLLCNVGKVPQGQKGFVVAKTILGILIGVLTIVFPFFMFGLGVLIGGIYLIVSSIAALVLVIKLW